MLAFFGFPSAVLLHCLNASKWFIVLFMFPLLQLPCKKQTRLFGRFLVGFGEVVRKCLGGLGGGFREVLDLFKNILGGCLGGLGKLLQMFGR